MNDPGTQKRPTRWSSDSVRAAERTDAWRSVLAESYCQWDVDTALAPGFHAELQRRDFGDLRVVDTRCDPCAGRRPKSVSERDGRRYFGIQIARAGRKQLELDGSAIDVGRGDMVLWTSDVAARFDVTERMHKVTLVLPWAELRERLPEGSDFKSTVIKVDKGISAVLFNHICGLGDELDALSLEDASVVRRTTLELVVATLAHRLDLAPRALARRYLERLQAYVLENLQDETLSPASIARANRISVRYVHLLFAQIDTSVSAWIRQQRLARCREALESATHRNESVSEIAYRWGFRDPLYFSRVFKKHYGRNPTQFRLDRAS